MSEEGVDLIENPIQQDADGTVATPNQEKRVGSPEINPAIASLRRDFDELNNVTLGKNIEDFEALMLVEHTDSSIFPPISPTEVAAKADELVAYDESTAELKLTPIEFLKKAKHLEHSLLKTINNHENIGNLINKRIDIEVRLEMLNEKKGISAFRAKNEISRLKKQLENVAHARELEEQNQKKLELKLGGVRKRKEELIQQQLGTALYEVVSKSDTFFQKLADDEGLTKELNSSYFHNIIIPFLKTNPFGGDSWREKLEFYNAQYSHLAESPDSEAISTLTRKSPLLNKDMLWEQTAGAYSTKVRVLKANQRQLIRDKIVRLIKAADPEYAAFRKEEGYLALMTAVSRRQLSTLTPFRKINRKNFAQIIKDEVRPESYDIPMHYAISKTPTMNFILGNKRYDFEPEATRQGKTGNGMLENEFTFYNPTPENLIQLAILASKNSTSGSRQDDLPKTVLCALTKRDDWNEVVSKTIQKYPDFAEAAQTLSKKFDPKKLIINYTDLRDSLVDLQANILCKKGDVDNELWESVFYKADTKAFLGAFLNKGYVSEEEYVRLIYQKLWISLEETLRLRERLYDNEDKAKKAVARTLRLIDFGERPEAKRLVENRDFKTLVTDLDVSDEKVNFLYDLPQQYPELITTGLFMFALRGDKQDLYLDDEGIRFLMEYSKLYGYPEKFQPIGLLHAVEQDLLTRERVLELSGKMDNFDDLYEAALDPTVFLQTDEDIDFFYKFRNAWDDNGVKNLKSLCIKSLVQHDTNRNLILNLPTKCSWIGEKSKVNLAEKIFEYSYRLLETPEDINFINTLVGMHGNKAAPLLEGYVKCLDAEVIDKKNKDIVIEFTKKYRVLTPNLLSGYIAAKNEGTSEMYIAQLNSLLE